MQLIDTKNILFTGFQDEKKALSFRSTNGGRVFVTDKPGVVIWFSHTLTPSEIFRQPILKG